MTNYIEQFMKDNDLQPEERFEADGCTFCFNDTFSLVYVEGYEANDGMLRALLSGEIKIKKLKKEPRKPTIGGYVWSLGDYGNIIRASYWGDKDEKYFIYHRLVFKTKEEAEDYKWFLDKVDKYKKPFKHGDDNFYFYHDYENNKIRASITSETQSQGVIYFSEENIDKFFEEVGEDRIKKYMFGVYD